MYLCILKGHYIQVTIAFLHKHSNQNFELFRDRFVWFEGSTQKPSIKKISLHVFEAHHDKDIQPVAYINGYFTKKDMSVLDNS